METFVLNHALVALFLLSFLASTLVPLGSEWLLVALVVKGLPVQTLVLTATLGNSLGACTTYAVGLWGSTLVIDKVLRLDRKQVDRAMELYGRYGAWSLLLSWLPVIGDPLCLAAGLLKLHFPRFAGLVLLGKLGRYAALAAITSGTL